MPLRRTCLTALSIALLVTLLANQSGAETKRRFNLGYFEAGPYPVHTLLRSEFYSQLEQLIADEFQFVKIPSGFRSASWKRDSCRIMAAELARTDDIDILIALGPWVIHDLLEAGFDKPIIGMHQFDPVAEGLLDSDWRPVADNLTVHQRPDRITADLAFISSLVDIKRLGFLYFPSADEKDILLERVKRVAAQLGIEVVTADEYDNYGTFAYFKSFHSLDKDIDAIYLAPLWGLKTANLGRFLELVNDAGVPSLTSEGKLILEKGAFATRSYYSAISEAKFGAVKAARIMRGELPADLPVSLRCGQALGVNNATAIKCGVSLPQQVLSDFQVVEAPASGETPYYSLSDAVNRAMSQNPGYLAVYQALDAAAKAARQVSSDYLPHIYGTTRLTHIDDNLTHNFRGLISDHLYNTSLHLEQRVFSLETIREIQLASSRHELEKINLGQAQLDLELAVNLAYLNFLRVTENLNAHRVNRSLIEHNLELALTENQIDQGDSLDVIRLEDERYQATLRVIQAEADLRIAGVLLNELFNMSGNDPFLLDTVSFSEEAFLVGEGNLYRKMKDRPSQQALENSLLAQALALNPGTRYSQARIDIQKQLLAKNTSRYFPSVGLRASLNFSNWLEETPTFHEESTTWSVGGFLNLPIFLGADRSRERARLKAELNELEYSRDDASLDVMSQVQANLHRLIGAANSLTPSVQSRRRSRQFLDAVVPAYNGGRVELLGLLDAQTNSLEADLAAINARFSYYDAMARLAHAVGWTAHDTYSNFRDEFHRRAGK
jgi:outer membrane protein TolC/ABC-type uncharacterized transport system substrate-binding protein